MFVIKKEIPVEIKKKDTDSLGDDYQLDNNIITSYIKYDDIPIDFRNDLISKFITPIEKNINLTFQQLQTLGSPQALDIIKRQIKIITDNLKNIKENIVIIQTSEALALTSDIEIK